MENNYELFHWGVKGMRWGIRRYQNKDGTLTLAGKKRYDKEMARLKEEERVLKNKAATRAKLEKLDAKRKSVEDRKKAFEPETKHKLKDSTSKKSIKDMSDQELQSAVNRLNLERSYKSLTDNESAKKTAGRGKKFVGDVLEQSGKNLATQTLNVIGAAVLNYAIGKSTKLAKRDSDGNLIDQIFTNNKKKS